MGGFLIWIIFTLFIQNFSHALEGFSNANETPQAHLEEAWEATVELRRVVKKVGSSQSFGREIGSGVVVSYSATRQTAIIVTNAHIGGCVTPYKCQYDVSFFTDKKSQVTFNGSSVKKLKDFPSYDLAFFEIELKNKLVPQVARLASVTHHFLKGSTVVAIGHPDLSLRKNSHWVGTKPSGSKKHTKRFSEGQTLGTRPQMQFSGYPYVANTKSQLNLSYAILHNADTLGGNSGGPLVNSHGEVIAIVTGKLNMPPGHPHCESPHDSHTPDCIYFSVPSDLILKKLQDVL